MKPPFHSQTLKVADLHYDESYHAPPRQATIDRVASAGWSPRAAGQITVNERSDGSLYVIDGVLRVAVCQTLGIEEIGARVMNASLTVEEEAKLYLAINMKKGRAA